MNEENIFLKLENVTKKFGETLAVNNVSLTIPQGQIFALLGSSGCGKSTLLRMLAGFETPSSGVISLNNSVINELKPYERPINMMFQSYALFPHLDVFENIAFGLKRQGLDKESIKKRVFEMLDIVKLAEFSKRKPNQLSGGQQQRVALARSLARSPSLLLLDEPLGALDKKLRQETQFELKRIIKSVGVTCVMVTHDQDEAMTMADQIAVMSNGQLEQVGSAKEIYEKPINSFVADFVGDINIFDGEVQSIENEIVNFSSNGYLLQFKKNKSINISEKIRIAVRPEKIRLLPLTTEPSKNSLIGRISEVAYLGNSINFVVKINPTMFVKALLSNSSDVSPQLSKGDDVYCQWDIESPIVLK
ncbi:ABC transporter ATP-binding protein [Polynucleobacter rarus]|uniref:ABC transporter ATP-binding protein n=1 Tax=Polynucleobacter rarus TaxID=556055 RepID=UPI000D3EAB18|nr:ABC transporter ATP-binding protein [Polynucleobacter rarus]